MATNEKWEIAIGLSDYVWHRKEENKEGNEAPKAVALPLFDMNFRAKKEITDSFLLQKEHEWQGGSILFR